MGSQPGWRDFEERFAPTVPLPQAEHDLRDAIKPVIGAANADEEVSFYKHFVAFRFDGLEEGGVLRMEVINRLQELIAINEDGQDLLLFDRLCRIAREGRQRLRNGLAPRSLAQLRGAVRLKIIPYLGDDINRLNAYSLEALNVVSEKVDDFYVERAELQEKVRKQLDHHRVVTIGGLPGCGKSVVLKRFAQVAASSTAPFSFSRMTASPARLDAVCF